jgi:hypothetical protein
MTDYMNKGNKKARWAVKRRDGKMRGRMIQARKETVFGLPGFVFQVGSC